MASVAKQLLTVIPATLLFAACGDTVENVNQTGADVVGSVADLPKCTDKNKGELALVEDDASVRVCVNREWIETKSGVDSDFNCSTEELKDGSGLKIVCNGDSIGVVLNGSDGKAGKDGNDGEDGKDAVLPGDTLEADSERVAVSLDSLAGYSQKGPFLKGSTVYLYELSDGRTLKQTNGNFTSIITRDDGRYKFTARDLVSQYAMIVVDGNYRNEVTGKSSEAPIRLRAITDMRKRSDANINLLTHLEFDRVYYLVTREKKTIKQAKKQAQNEIFAAFHIDTTGIKVSAEDLDVFGKTDADAALLAISVLLQGDGNATDLSILLTEIADDMETDGKWDGPGSDTLRAKVADWAVYADGQGRLRDFRKNVSDWRLSENEPPAFEKFIRNFVNIETKLGKCGSETIPVGTVKKIDDPRSKYYAKDYEDTTKTKERFICADADSAWWRLATDIEKDTAGWGTGTNNVYDYEVRPGRVNRDHYYYNAFAGETWREADVIEYDTYDYENNRAWADDPSSAEGDIRTGTVTGWKIYVYMNENGQMTWRIADIVEAQLGGCVAGRDSVGYAHAICLEGGSIDACGSHLVNLNISEGYYICHDTRGEDNPLWEWGLATLYEYDTYKLPHDTTGRVLKGRVTDKNYYVWDGSMFRIAGELDIAVGRNCSERNIDQVVKYVVDEETPKVYKCQDVGMEDFGWQQIDGETPMENRMGYVVDADETQYPVFVDPKGQVWMSKNLDIEVDSSYCYNDEEKYCVEDGRLYTWNAARNACPEGWHLPDGAEYQSLKESVESGYLVTKSNWLSSYGAGSDEYGFMAYPAGFRRVDGTYGVSLNASYAFFWTSSEYNGQPECVLLNRGEFNVGANNFEKDEAIFVRCVLD